VKEHRALAERLAVKVPWRQWEVHEGKVGHRVRFGGEELAQ